MIGTKEKGVLKSMAKPNKRRGHKRKLSTMELLVKGTALLMVVLMLISVILTLYLSLQSYF